MSNKKRKPKAGQHKRRVDRQIVGLTMKWFDENPDGAGEIQYPQLSHKNPVMRTAAKKMWEENLDYMQHRSQFRWLICVSGIFSCDSGESICPVEVEARCVLTDMTLYVQKAVRGVMERGNRKLWKGAEISIECLGM